MRKHIKSPMVTRKHGGKAFFYRHICTLCIGHKTSVLQNFSGSRVAALEAMCIKALQAHLGKSVMCCKLRCTLANAQPPKRVAYPIRQLGLASRTVNFSESGNTGHFALVANGKMALLPLCVLVVCNPARYHFQRARVGNRRCGADMNIIGQGINRIAVCVAQ